MRNCTNERQKTALKFSLSPRIKDDRQKWVQKKGISLAKSVLELCVCVRRDQKNVFIVIDYRSKYRENIQMGNTFYGD